MGRADRVRENKVNRMVITGKSLYDAGKKGERLTYGIKIIVLVQVLSM